MLEIGKTVSLEVLRSLPIGLILGDDEDEVLLPRRYVPDQTELGDTIEVFLYTDSEDRPIATTERPLAEVDQFACLRVVSVTSTGAFLDWGLSKDLLLPFGSQPVRVRPEQRVVVRVLLDTLSGRPVATAKFHRYLESPPDDLREGHEVEWMVYEETDLGSKAIVEGRFEGLIYHTPGTHTPGTRGPEAGSSGKGYIKQIRQDGKIDLSLAPIGRAAIVDAREVLLLALQRSGGRLELGDRSDPEEIRRILGLSKKAFKRAAGALYRERRIRIGEASIESVDPPDVPL